MNSDNNDLIPMGAPALTFDTVMRGYERNQVNEAIKSLEDDLRTIMSERDRAIGQVGDEHARAEQLAGELAELKNQLRETQAPTFETMGGRIASMLRLAEEEAAEIRRAAETEAGSIKAEASAARAELERGVAGQRAEADQYAADRRSEADEHYAATMAAATEHLESHRKQAEEHVANARSEAAELMAASLAQRTEADEDFKINLDSRRRQAQEEHAERERISQEEAAERLQSSREEADELLQKAHAGASAALAEADERAHAMIERAEDEVNRLENVRAALAQQIARVGQIVGQVPAYLAKAPQALVADRDVDAPRAGEPRRQDLFSGERDTTPSTAAQSAANDQAQTSTRDAENDPATEIEHTSMEDVETEGSETSGVDSEPSGADDLAVGGAQVAATADEAAGDQPEESESTDDSVGSPSSEQDEHHHDLAAEPAGEPAEDTAAVADEDQHRAGAPTSARPRIVLSRRGSTQADSPSPSERTVQVSAIKQRKPRR